MKCRFCENKLTHTFADLGFSPPSNSFLDKDDLNEPEIYYPLKVYVCEKCHLVQIDEYKKHSEIFSEDYIYFSSFSKTWLEHSKKYVDMVSQRFNLTKETFVTEIASNDGYLLQYFKLRGIPCIGIEPTASTAKVSVEKGIDTWQKFWGEDTAIELVKTKGKSKLILGNNVFAHVPNLHDFVKGLKIGLAEDGVITLEFPHLLNLIKLNQFDTIYHEHFSYLSLLFCQKIFTAYELDVFDVEELETHGGSLRLYISHKSRKTPGSQNVQKVLNDELEFGLDKLSIYESFQRKINEIKIKSMDILIKEKMKGKKIAAYGAAAKGNTFLNYCGMKSDLIEFVIDSSPSKQGKFLPGSHIPVVSINALKNNPCDLIIVLPWNLFDEISLILQEQGLASSQIIRMI